MDELLPPLVKRYLDLCAAYATKPCPDVAVWLRLQAALPEAADPPDMPPREQHRGWKMKRSCGFCMQASDSEEAIKKGAAIAALADANIATTLVISSQKLQGTANFTDMDMLPLCDLLLEPVQGQCHEPLDKLRNLDFSRCRLGRSGVLLLCKRVLASPKCRITRINLSNQWIGSTGAAALAAAAQTNHNLHELILHNCMLRNDGGLVFAKLLSTTSSPTGLETLDLSNNVIPFATCIAIETVAGMKMTPDNLQNISGPISVNTNGNRVFDEVLNAVSHGAAFILAIVGAVFLGRAVRESPTHYKWSVTLYLFSLIFLFLASTLYHSFFSLKATRAIFSVIDHSAIFLLIAGSYTPILAILFVDKPEYSQHLLGFMWGMCALGICVTAILADGKVKDILSLTLYLSMGWAAILITEDMNARLALEGWQLLVGGGLMYTVGVPFFVKNGQTLSIPDHTIWHFFVLAGAFTHYLFIFSHIVPFSVPVQEAQAEAAEGVAAQLGNSWTNLLNFMGEPWQMTKQAAPWAD